MSLRETLSKSITFTVMNESGKGALVEIEMVFRPVYHVAHASGPLTQDFLGIHVIMSCGVRNFRNI